MSETANEPIQRSSTTPLEARAKARAALEKRAKKNSDTFYYWAVIIGFIVICGVCIIYVFYEWRESPNLVLAVDQRKIDEFNAKESTFRRGPNNLFLVRSARR